MAPTELNYPSQCSKGRDRSSPTRKTPAHRSISRVSLSEPGQQTTLLTVKLRQRRLCHLDLANQLAMRGDDAIDPVPRLQTSRR